MQRRKQRGRHHDNSSQQLRIKPIFSGSSSSYYNSLPLRLRPREWRRPPPPGRSSRCWLPRRASLTSLCAASPPAATAAGVGSCSSRRRWAPAPAPAVGQPVAPQAPTMRTYCWAGPRCAASRRSPSSLPCSWCGCGGAARRTGIPRR